jgi:hypothetical protein
MIDFVKDQRKDDVMQEYPARSDGSEGVLFIGRAQEKARIFRTEKRRNPTTGVAYPWIVTATAKVNHFYFYAVNDDFGPFFLQEDYAKPSLKKYKPTAARNEDKKVFSGLL